MSTSVPLGAFRGSNMIAPEVVSFHRVPDGWAELATGGPFLGEVPWGVTHSPGDWDAREVDRSRCLLSRSEALRFIRAGCPAEWSS